MKNLLLGVLLSLMAGSVSAHSIVIVVPLDISGLPPDVYLGTLACRILNAAREEIGHTSVNIPLVEGGYHGQVRVSIRPAGYPISVNPIPDVDSYHCGMSFEWRCTSSAGDLGRCSYYGGGSGRGAVLFETQPGHPEQLEAESAVDPADAVELPRLE